MASWTQYISSRVGALVFRGALLVQMMSAGFWRGKEFRAYREITANTQMRFHATKPFLLTYQSLYCDDGRVTMKIYTGVTPSGVWTPITTINAKNRLTSNPVPENTMDAGGSFTGGTERELLCSDSGGGQGAGYENRLGGTRGLPAGDYYFDIVVAGTGTTYAIYSLEWEELEAVIP